MINAQIYLAVFESLLIDKHFYNRFQKTALHKKVKVKLCNFFGF